MIIRSVRHRGLRRLLEHDDPRFVRSEWIARVRKILTVLILAEDIDRFAAYAPRGWRSTASLATVKVNGVSRSPATGGLRLKSRMAASTA